MFVREHQNQFRIAQADVQRFYGAFNNTSRFSWNKPVGVSFIYMLLVGGGAGGNNLNGGATGAVTVWMGNANLVPNTLTINLTSGSGNVNITYPSATSGGTLLLSAFSGSSGPTPPGATPANFFANSGFYKSTAGQTGSSLDPSAPSTTFLSPGGGTGTTAQANYGYVGGGGGYLLLSPILVSTSAINPGRPGYGSGGPINYNVASAGFVIIASW